MSATARRARRARGLPALLEFAAAMTACDARSAGRALVRARRAGASRVAAEEIALMLTLHAGYPAALEAMRVIAARWPGRARRRAEGAPALWRRRGLALCRRVYGPVFGRLLAHVRSMHPDLAVWMVEHGYGRVLSRAGLGDRERELAAVTVLAATAWERQLVSHLKGALRLGASRREVLAAFDRGLRRSRSPAACRRALRHALGGNRSRSRPRSGHPNRGAAAD